jgi:3-hexulose-6-phosphate synthase
MTRASLQLALDFPAALGVLPRVHRWVDIVEVGTPLLKRFGLSVIATVKEAAPHALVLADSKTVDGGRAESAMLFDAGADIVTVLSCASAATFVAVGEEAEARGKSVLLDTVTESDPLRAAVLDYPVAFRYFALHTATDSRFAGDLHATDSFAVARKVQTSMSLVLAGGINADNFEQAAQLQPGVIVVGRAITAADDPGAVAEWMHGVLA